MQVTSCSGYHRPSFRLLHHVRVQVLEVLGVEVLVDQLLDDWSHLLIRSIWVEILVGVGWVCRVEPPLRVLWNMEAIKVVDLDMVALWRPVGLLIRVVFLCAFLFETVPHYLERYF